MSTMPRQPVLKQTLAVLAGVVGVWVGVASAGPRVLVDRSLARSRVDLLGFNEGTVLYLDGFGREREDPAGVYLAVLPPPGGRTVEWARPAEEDLAGGTPVVVELTDGRRYIGAVGPFASDSVRPPDPGGDALVLLRPGFGPRAVSLEDIARIVIDPWSSGPGPTGGVGGGVEDELILTNGDRLGGFLVSFGDGIVFDTGGGEAVFDLHRVAEVRLGNPPGAWSGPRVWLSTGEVLSARAAGELVKGSVGVRDDSAGAVVVFAVNAIDAAWLGEGGVIGLGSIEPDHVEPLGGRRWTAPVRSGSPWSAPLGVPDVVLPGPMRAEWALPAGATRFGVVARLGGTLKNPLALPGRWSDARLRVAVAGPGGEAELALVSLDREHPSEMIAAELPGAGEPGRRLILELRPGRYGPIQDRVLLDAPMLSVP